MAVTWVTCANRFSFTHRSLSGGHEGRSPPWFKLMRLGEPGCRWQPAVSARLYVPSMPRSATVTAFECSACGWRTSKWVGRCGDCEAWGTVIEGRGEDLGRATSRAQLRAAQPATAAVPIGQIDAAAAKAVPTGISELDRVRGGGLVPGA